MVPVASTTTRILDSQPKKEPYGALLGYNPLMLLTIYCAVIGLIIGSAINAIVWRLYVGRKWTRGRSVCPDCEHELAAKDLVPVASWLWLKGKCRYCGSRIHWQYPVVESVTAVLFALSAYTLAPQTTVAAITFAFWLTLLTLLIIMAVFDARWMILPDKIMKPAIVIAAISLAYQAYATHSWLMLRGPIGAALVMGGLFYIIAVGSGGNAMGGGDIKLVFLMGLILGAKASALALFLAFNSAALVGIILLATKQKKRRDLIPFGPYLVGATIFAYLYAQPIVNWYLQLNGLS